MAWPAIIAGAGAAIGSALGGALGGSGDDAGAKILKRQMQLLQAVRAPNFDFSQLTPAQLEFIAQVDPVFYQASVPDSVKLMAESGARADEYGALQGLQRIGAEGLPLADRLAAGSAVDTLGRGYGNLQQAVLRNLAERGRASGGLGAEMQLSAASDLSDLYGRMGRDVVQQSLQRRMDALGASGQLAGQIRSADQSREAQNAAMVNRFKEFISNARTDQARYAADAVNMNRIREAEGRQAISNANRMNVQDVAESNLNRRNYLEGALADFGLARAGGTSNLAGALAKGARASDARQQELWSQVGTAGGQLAGALASLYSPKDKKEK
ncbi:MAG: hypothetical protein JW940_21565 [Polyangiaceae bacterium]|nr:hypothetical protein [Polyangiaceae bacterium]